MDQRFQIRPQTLNMTEKKVWNKLELTGPGKKTFKEACSTALRPTFNKWNHMKQTFFMVKEIISWEKHQVREWEKIVNIQISNTPYLKYIKKTKLDSQNIIKSIDMVCMNTLRIFKR